MRRQGIQKVHRAKKTRQNQLAVGEQRSKSSPPSDERRSVVCRFRFCGAADGRQRGSRPLCSPPLADGGRDEDFDSECVNLTESQILASSEEPTGEPSKKWAVRGQRDATTRHVSGGRLSQAGVLACDWLMSWQKQSVSVSFYITNWSIINPNICLLMLPHVGDDSKEDVQSEHPLQTCITHQPPLAMWLSVNYK